MDCRFAVDPRMGWGRVTISGEVALNDLARLLEAAWADPPYSKVEAAIWNVADVRTEMRLDRLLQLSAWISAAKAGRGAKSVALVASDDLAFGLSRMFQAVQPSVGVRLGVFREEAAAAHWLQRQLNA